MRKLMLAAAALIVLAGTGIAGAWDFGHVATARSLSGTFNANTPVHVFTRMCTTTDGKTLAVTHGRYTGMASGDPDLTGPITVDARSLINQTDDVGVVQGRLWIAVGPGTPTVARFDAVYDHGKLAGLATGRAVHSHAKLIANLSSGFSTAGGFMTGAIGATAGGSAVELGPGRCAPQKSRVHIGRERSDATGTVSAVSATSISVAGLTCIVPPALSGKVTTRLHMGDRAEIRCALAAGQNTLVRFEKRH
jgi:hypothetical protein